MDTGGERGHIRKFGMEQFRKNCQTSLSTCMYVEISLGFALSESVNASRED